jgi:hypothetical protein
MEAKMNVFNRIVVVLLVLLLLAGVILLAVVPNQAVQSVERGLTGFGTFLTGASESYYWLFMIARVLIVLAALFLFGWLLWRELKRNRPKAVKLTTEGGSKATVTTESVEKRLAWHIDQLADVISVTPVVSPAGRAVNVVVNLETRPEIDVPMKTDEVVGVVREVITERMGLQLGKVQVHIKHAPYQEEA